MGACFSDSNKEEDVEEVVEEIIRKPPHYRDREGPRYRVVNFTRDYEYRKYEHSTWICVRVNDEQYKKSISKGESTLAKYFQGNNGPEKIMNDTCPLRIQIDFQQNLERPGDYVVAKHLPHENCSRPPAPKRNEMFIQDFPAQFAYVSTFEGVPNETDISTRLMSLANVLKNEGREYEGWNYYTTKFESSLSLKKKVNEVILFCEKADT